MVIEYAAYGLTRVGVTTHLYECGFAVVNGEHLLVHGRAVGTDTNLIPLALEVLSVKGSGFQNVNLQPIDIYAPNF